MDMDFNATLQVPKEIGIWLGALFLVVLIFAGLVWIWAAFFGSPAPKPQPWRCRAPTIRSLSKPECGHMNEPHRISCAQCHQMRD